MKGRSDPEVSSWLAKRDEDLRMMDLAWASGEPLWSPICFHAQQAAEKALKALAAALGREPPRVHDLEVLCRAVRADAPAVEGCMDDAAFLSDFAVLSRYPQPEEIGRPRAERAVAAARRLIAVVDATLDR